jgi:hypothetical protein
MKCLPRGVTPQAPASAPVRVPVETRHDASGGSSSSLDITGEGARGIRDFCLGLSLQVESFLSTAVDQLLNDADLAPDGILNGGWLATEDGNIDGEIFTERAMGATYDEAAGLLPALADRTPFAVRFVPQSKLRPLLEEISQFSVAEPAPRQFLGKLQQESFRWTY